MITIGHTYTLKQFSATLNTCVPVDALVLDFQKLPGQNPRVKLKVKWKVRYMTASAFKAKIL